MSTIINVKDLGKTYRLYQKAGDRLKEAVLPFKKNKLSRPFHALSDVTFSVETGETVGIIGKNGSGKSTLLKILTGVITPSNGTAEVGGKVSALLELGAGFNPEYTGIENIYLNGTIMGYSRAEMDGRMQDILDFAEIGDFVYQPVKTYSSGMFVRLAFAVAINVQPEILIVDEALAVGDYRFQAKCYNKFEELKAQGKTILFVTHDVDAVRRFCSRALWIHEGKLIMDGSVNDVTSRYMEFITGGAAQPDTVTEKKPAGSAGHTAEKEAAVQARTEFQPINRFGSHMGSIYYVETFSGDKPTVSFGVGETVRVRIAADIPEGVNIADVGAAVSVKNKSGLDLFVTSTYDKDIHLTHTGENQIEVSFKNYLNAGEYTLICALENRAAAPITYYDYIEGAAYIKVTTKRELYGLAQFPSEITVNAK